MGVRRSGFRGLAILALAAVGFVPYVPASGQSSSDSSTMDSGLQMLQGLSPDQRDAIKNQLGIGGGGTGGALGGNSQSMGGGNQQNDQLQGVVDQDLLDQLKRQEEDIDLRSPYLKGDDWVIVSIDINPLPPLNQSPNQQQQQTQQQQQQQQQQGNGLPNTANLPASALSALSNTPGAAAALGGQAVQGSNGVGPNQNTNNGNSGNGQGNGNSNAPANPNLQQVVKPELTDEELK